MDGKRAVEEEVEEEKRDGGLGLDPNENEPGILSCSVESKLSQQCQPFKEDQENNSGFLCFLRGSS